MSEIEFLEELLGQYQATLRWFQSDLDDSKDWETDSSDESYKWGFADGCKYTSDELERHIENLRETEEAIKARIAEIREPTKPTDGQIPLIPF